MEKIYKTVMNGVSAGKIDKESAVEILKILKQEESRNIRDIAIIGIAFKIPGIGSLDEFWDNMNLGVDCVQKLPADRRNDILQYMHFKKMQEEDIVFKEGSFLDSIDKFDCKFFRLSPREASLMDPCQRLFLQVAYQALEDAGYGGNSLAGSKTGVYLGYSASSDYYTLVNDVEPEASGLSTTGNIASVIASRVSYILDLKGPAMVVDTACSSSLVSLHLACSAIKKGECETAIVGGARISLYPVVNRNQSIGVESTDGRTRSFDDNSDGSGIGEGIAALLIKPLASAVRDGDNIYAVIKGSAINQDGTSLGLTAPNPAAQTEVIINSWNDAGIDPETISLIEAHGTATQLGDTVEIDGLVNAFNKYTYKKQFCAIGSVKSNLGHLFENSGLTGIIKVICALRQKKIPPAILFNKPNSKIRFNDSPIYVNTIAREWNTGGNPRRCGVSAFGLSGTNCHVVLEEAPEIQKPGIKSGTAQIIAISAKSEGSLKRLISSYIEFLGKNSGLSLNDIAFTLNTGRGHYGIRMAIIAENTGDFLDKLSRIDRFGYENINEEWFFFSKIPARDVLPLYREAEEKIKSLGNVDSGRETIHKDICALYINGADIKWKKLYKNSEYKKLSLPVYQFENYRCWVDIPEPQEKPKDQENEMFYSTYWVQEDLKEDINEDTGTVAVFKNSEGTGDELIAGLRQKGLKVIEVEDSLFYSKIGDAKYKVPVSEEDYIKFFMEAGSRGICKIIHMMTLENSPKYDNGYDCDRLQRNGVMSLFHISKAIIKSGFKRKTDLVLVSNHVSKVTGKEEYIVPENALLFGLSKLIGKELPWITPRCFDIDCIDDIVVQEIVSKNKAAQVAVRQGKRFVEVFGQIQPLDLRHDIIEFKEDGVYVVTGGTGGLGLAFCEYISGKKNVKLALINRSGFPERERWKDILHFGDDEKLLRKIKTLMKIEASGSSVSFHKADVSNFKEMESVFSDLKQRYGKINGIIHAAGIAKDNLLENKSLEEFNEVMAPKVLGTRNIDKLTDMEKVEFIILFSSVATIFSAVGQGDYIAANSFLDSYTYLLNKKGKRALTIDWTTWKEAGMAADSGFNADTIFKTMPTNVALDLFERIIPKQVERVTLGRINYDGIGTFLLKQSGVRLSKDINDKLNEYSLKKSGIRSKIHAGENPDISRRIKLSGKENGEYTSVERSIAGICSRILGYGEIDIYDNFFELGADSIIMIKIHEEIMKEYPGKVNIVEMFEYSNISSLSKYIAGREITGKNREDRKASDQKDSSNDIAVIGIDLRMPMADNIEEFWQNLKSGIEAVSQPSPGRKKDIEKLAAYKNIPLNIVEFETGGFLEEIDRFDSGFFRIPPREAILTDPNHRMFLEVAFGAIEDAGYRGRIEGSNTGIYLGYAASNMSTSYMNLASEIDTGSKAFSVTGNVAALSAGRVSYFLNLKGPSMVIDTACSASLAAVHLALKGLKNGDCDMAIAGGVKINVIPAFQKGVRNGIGMESSDGRTRTFDEYSDGTGQGEGVAAILLKPLSRAIEDRDNIYAVIKGSAMNQDGTSAGLTAPNPSAQEDVILKAWNDSGIDPGTITYIETHGTGTQLGDTIEIKGIQNAFGKYTTRKQFCALGALKTNIGHLSEAAGIAGLIKAVLALKHGEIPPNLNFERPNHNIMFYDSPVYVNTVTKKWETGFIPKRCGISGFGMSGTNCHIVLEEYVQKVQEVNDEVFSPNVLVLSAKTEEALLSLVRDYSLYMKQNTCSLHDICYTAAAGREHYQYRLALVVGDTCDLENKLNFLREKGLDGICWPAGCFGRHKVVGENRENIMRGEITERQQQLLGEDADSIIDGILQTRCTVSGSELYSGLNVCFKKLCDLYALGANVNWEKLFEGRKNRKVSLPLYPFERKRCWIEIPEVVQDNTTDGLFYNVSWKREELIKKPKLKSSPDDGLVLVFKDTRGISEKILKSLIQEGFKICEVALGKEYYNSKDGKFIISGDEEDYKRLLSDLGGIRITKIIHMFTVTGKGEAKTLHSLENRLKKGLYSLFYLTRALANRNLNIKTDTVLVTLCAEEVTGEETWLNPEGAAMCGMGKVIRQEQQNMAVRCIDIDDETEVDFVLQELKNDNGVYKTAYRKGARYVEEFSETGMGEFDDDIVEIKKHGVYVITGGTGGIGLEMAKYIASRGQANIALVSRSPLPERESWEDILEQNRRDKTGVIEIIKSIKEIERSGSKIELFSADVSDGTSVKRIIGILRKKYRNINGIIHSAGVAGEGFLVRKDKDRFNEVVNPKIKGTWLLDKYTCSDEMDFFVLFSSVAAVFPSQGQGDYAAANAFLDAYSTYRNRKNRKTLTINWVSWKETGMGVRYGVNVDGNFKALPTEAGIEAFNRILNKKITGILVGKLVYGSETLWELQNIPLRMSDPIQNAIDRSRELHEAKAVALVKSRLGNVRLSGKDSEEYTAAERKIAQACREILGFEEVDIYENFFDMGMDSIMITGIHSRVDAEYPGKITVIDMFEYANVFKLAGYIASKEENNGQKEIAIQKQDYNDDDIAVIGMSLKFPMAQTAEEFWMNILNGVETISGLSYSRKEDILKLIRLNNIPSGSVKFETGGFLDGIDGFDYSFFGISPNEAKIMDPSHRLFLMTAWEAIEDAGYGGNGEKSIRGSNTGLYLGYSAGSTYKNMVDQSDASQKSLAALSNSAPVAAGRISYLFDLKGPSMVLDTACSASLVAVHLACKALKNGDCDTAIAGGVRINILPVYKKDDGIKMGYESPDGITRAFDDYSDGTGIGEGAGALLLKPLKKAIEDRDNIHAIIKGSAVNQDGHSAGLTAPNAVSQEEVLVKAWKDAGINPESISYIETHGTGTRLGDPIEIKGIRNAFKRFTDERQFCAIGFLKSNTGHLFEAAGMASLIKVILSMKHRMIPPGINFNRPNGNIHFYDSPVYVNTIPRKWDVNNGYPRRCGVSGFGISGTNCHVVLEEFYGLDTAKEDNIFQLKGPQRPEIFTVSAKSLKSLFSLLEKYYRYLDEESGLNPSDVSYTLNTGRGHFSFRIAFVATDYEELKTVLKSIIDNENKDFFTGSKDVFFGKHKILSSDRENKAQGEITDGERKELSIRANVKIKEFMESGEENGRILSEICGLYTKGADVDWEHLYAGKKTKKISLPAYSFEKNRCWAEPPLYLEKAHDGELKEYGKNDHEKAQFGKAGCYYGISWREERLPEKALTGNGKTTVLVLRNETGRGEIIASMLKQRGNTVIEAISGENYLEIGSSRFKTGYGENDYKRLLENLKGRGIDRIVHLLTIDGNEDVKDIDELKWSQKKGMYSLKHLVKALSADKSEKQVDVVLASEYVSEVTGEEERLNPENAPMFGLGRVIIKEIPGLRIRCIDMDVNTPADYIADEIEAGGSSYISAYRKGIRYVEEFGEISLDIKENETVIKQNGVYIITGGLGGIGLEIARSISGKAGVNLVLIGRSKFPGRTEWSKVKDVKTLDRIDKIKDIEEKGSAVLIYSADVGKKEELDPVLKEIRKKFGHINGIIHAAGISRDNPINTKNTEDFEQVIGPKIYGTWLLDNLTQEDNLDFLIMFSSVATVFSMLGQGDYVAANSYMDAFASYRCRLGLKTHTMDWTTWLETGMAAQSGFTADTIFKVLHTITGVGGFHEVLKSSSKRVLVGVLNETATGLGLLEKSGVSLSSSLNEKITKYRQNSVKKTRSGVNTASSEADIKLYGREKEDYTAVEVKVAQIFRKVLGYNEIDIYDNFFEMGADSIILIGIHSEIDREYPGQTGIVDLFEYSNIALLSKYITEKINNGYKSVKGKTFEKEYNSGDIAIIGVDLRFPMAQNTEEFWQNIRNGVETVSVLSPGRRKDIERLANFRNIPMNIVDFETGGFLNEIDKFDCGFFRIPPREAMFMDPSQRIFMEVASGAIEDAGYLSKIDGSDMGVYLGFAVNNAYRKIIDEIEPDSDALSMMGNVAALAAGRISYFFNLKGPSIVLDSACSASLTAVHFACKGIRSGDCSMAIAGGIRLNILPAFQKGSERGIGMESSDGRTRAFDDYSDGTGPGEGVAAIILKPLDRAVEDRDNIYAVIKGSAINQDGATAGLTAPNPAAQEEVIVSAWKDAGVDPETITYIEAHGTGTQLGDPIEIKGIRNAFERYTEKKQFCALGSVKTNIAHLSEAAGIAGVIKAVLALKNGEIPPNVNFERPNRKISFGDSPLYVSTVPKKWESGSYPRRCGVSGFGMSGTNCHVVMEEYVERVHNEEDGITGRNILVLSAKTEEALFELIRSYSEYMKHNTYSLEDICYTANTGRLHHQYRIGMVVKDLNDLENKLKLLSEKTLHEISWPLAFFGRFKVVDEKWEGKSEGDITWKRQQEIEAEADSCIEEISKIGHTGENVLNGASQEVLLRRLCELYTCGANIKWEKLYVNGKRRKVSLPLYPFERKRCWLEIPDILMDTTLDGLFYELAWKREEIGKKSRTEIASKKVMENEAVLVFKDTAGIGEKIVKSLRQDGYRIYEILPGKEYLNAGNGKFIISGTEEDYKKLFRDLGSVKISKIIHLFTVTRDYGIKTVNGLEKRMNRGIYSLFYIARALADININTKVDTVLVTRSAEEVTGEETVLNPESAAMYGLGKVIRLEQKNIAVRCIDIDDETGIDSVLQELKRDQGVYKTAYRKGVRYVEEFSESSTGYFNDETVDIKPQGVYIITGGTGGIGLEMAKYLAKKGSRNIALVSRTSIPQREAWDDILKQNRRENVKVAEIIKSIRKTEDLGAKIELLSADVSDESSVKTLIRKLKEKFGRINGIVHSAGVAGEGLLLRKEKEAFDTVLNPKIKGTWLLDKHTRNEEPDFFVLFSSVASVFSSPGQGDYAAANSYLDAYAAYRNRISPKTLTINWVSWKETGMGVRYGVNIDGNFKALPTKAGIDAFDMILNKKIKRMLVGKLVYEAESIWELQNIPVRLSNPIQSAVDRAREIYEAKREAIQKARQGDVVLTGKEDEEYTAAEKNIARVIRRVLGFEELDIHENFFEMGVDSIMLTEIHAGVDTEYPGAISVIDMFEYSSVYKLAGFIAGKDEIAVEKETFLKEPVYRVDEDIAIIGISLKVPMADNAEEFWSNICNKVESAGELNELRKKDVKRYIEFNKLPPDAFEYERGCFLDEIDKFDYGFFGISPNEAMLMEPGHRLFLMAVLETFEDAGYGGNGKASIRGSNTGLYLGYNGNTTYKNMADHMDIYSKSLTVLSNSTSIAAGRISYLFDLKGPSMVVDTACSASLVAVHLACSALRAGECETAIAGGVKINILPVYKKDERVGLGFESIDGRTIVFDDSSNGSGSGEGVGAVLLKPLKKAIEDRDNIYAVIKGSAVNQDGHSAGLTAPNPSSQEEVVIRAWKNAGIEPDSISYIEAHGTGTRLGDPIEIKGIQNAFKHFTDKKQFCAVGYLKSNIGHLAEASGVAALVKAILSMKNGIIPPGINFLRPNRNIDFCNSPVYINTIPQKWESNGFPRRCGINGFGMSGTNCHIVLEEYNSPSAFKADEVHKFKNSYMFTLSAKSRESLIGLAGRYYNILSRKKELNPLDVCYTLNTGRGHYNFRIAFTARDFEEIIEKLKYIIETESENFGAWSNKVFYRKHKIIDAGRETRSKGEITERERKVLSERASEKIKRFIDSDGNDDWILREICSLYAEGADVDWEALYDGKKPNRVSLPTYCFEKSRCWIQAPVNEESTLEENIKQTDDVLSDKSGFYYGVSWKEDLLPGKTATGGLKTLLVLRNETGKGETIASMLRERGNTVIEAIPDENCNENYYSSLVSSLKDREIDGIVHLLTLDGKEEIKDVDELAKSQEKGMYSLMNLAKALSDCPRQMDMVLVSEYVNEVTGNEEKLNPENAPLFGLGKVIRKEMPHLWCRCIDMDDKTPVEAIADEIEAEETSYIAAYRQGRRYVEEFGEINLNDKEPETAIKEKGVYIITGGLGGIGLEIARSISDKAKVNLVLIGRSKFPGRRNWDKTTDAKILKRINAIKEIEEKGSRVLIFSTDVAKREELEPVMEKIRKKFGRINGIVHAAGISRDNPIVKKGREECEQLIGPKIYGTWLLDKLTQEDKPDFLIMFSSVATAFSMYGQGDYVAGNSYMDSYAAYRCSRGLKTQSINWTAWLETGMAADSGFAVDTIFKMLHTEIGIRGFFSVLESSFKRVLIGVLNETATGFGLLEKSGVRLSYRLNKKLMEYRQKSDRKSKPEAYFNSLNGDVKLYGREKDDYTPLEIKIAEICRKTLGYDEMDIYDDFFKLGADSIILADIQSQIDMEYPGYTSIADLFKHSSIFKIAEHISSKAENNAALTKYPGQTENGENRDGIYPKIKPAGKQEYYPVSPLQRGLLLLSFLDNIGTSYNLPQINILDGKFDAGAFERALRQLIERHAVLRTSFHMIDGEPVQKIHETVDFRMNYLEIDESKLQDASRIYGWFLKSFNLETAPLFRVYLIKVNDLKHIILLDIHHIISDGISNDILYDELSRLYRGEVLEPLKIQYKDYALWYSNLMDTPFMKKQEEYWLEQLSGELPVLDFPFDYPRPHIQSFEGKHLHFELDEEMAKEIRKLVYDSRTTLYMLLLSVLNIIAYKYTGQEDVLIGSPIAGRPFGECKNIIGMFVNTLVMRNYPKGEMRFCDFLSGVRQNCTDAYSNQYYPLTSLVEKVYRRRDLSRNPLFDIMFVLQNYEYVETGVEGYSSSFTDDNSQIGNPASKFDIVIEALEKRDKIEFSVEYCSRLFNETTIQRLASHFSNAVSSIIKNPEIILDDIDILGEDERKQLIYDFNDNRNEFNEDLSVHNLFEMWAENTPDSTAVVFEGREHTYGEINKRANKMANFLLEAGLQKGEPVAVLLERGPIFVEAVLGIWKAGGAYIPIDSGYPEQRILNILDESRAPFAIARNSTGRIAEEYPGRFINLDVCEQEIENASCENPDIETDKNGLAYVIYTSGSTGIPKGAMIEHAGMMNHIHEEVKVFGISKDSIIAQNAPCSFDISVWQFFAALTAGGRIVIYPDDAVKDVRRFTEGILNDGITALEVVPSYLKAVLEFMEENSLQFESLEFLLVTGEAANPVQIKKWFELNPGTKVVNAYGPAEASDDIAQYIMDYAPDVENIPIGKPVQNTNIYIADSKMNLCPIGVKGEIWVSGKGVGRGYLNNPDKTIEVFSKDPFRNEENIRLYKTGDTGRRLPDGNIEFSGRKDRQVKINGYRIEPEEIKIQLLKSGIVKEAEVLAKEINGSSHLCAYIASQMEVDVEEIKKHLSGLLPAYMIPAYYIILEKMPLNANGKVDLKALPAPVMENEKGTDPQGVKSRIQLRIALVWESILGTGKIGINDNFFDLGGDSIKAIRIVSKLSGEFNVTLNDLFMNQTIKELSDNIAYNENNLKEQLENAKKMISEPRITTTDDIEEIQMPKEHYLKRINEYDEADTAAQKEYKNILLAGATGFLGIHLLNRILKDTDAEVSLLIRGKEVDDARERLEGKFNFHFGDEALKPYLSRLKYVKGDLSKKNLGLEPDEYNNLALEIDCVINSAADTSYYGDYESLYNINVEGTGRLIDLCSTIRKKDYHHISTVSIGSGSVDGKDYCLFTEFDSDIGQKTENMHARTMLDAEKLVLDARQKGLTANIYRLGNLVFDSGTGIFRENISGSAFYNLVRAGIKLGIVPEADDINIDFSFIDYTARAVTLLFNRTGLVNETFHIINPEKVNIVEFAGMIKNAGYAIETINTKEFLDFLFENRSNEFTSEYIENNFIRADILNISQSSTRFEIRQDKTDRILDKLGFKWKKLNGKITEKMIRYCEKIGFI